MHTPDIPKPIGVARALVCQHCVHVHPQGGEKKLAGGGVIYRGEL